MPSLLIADAVRVFGGAERFVLDAARGLGDRGWDVTVLVHPGSPLHHRALDAGTPVRTARTRANGAPWTVIPLGLWMRRRRFDAVLSVYDKDLRTAAWAARLFRPSTTILHSRECDAPIKDRPWIRWFHRHVADGILVNSEATARTTRDSAPWLDPSRIVVVPKGVDLGRFAPRPSEREPHAPMVVGFAGQLVARKRVGTLVDAIARVGSPVVLRIAGDGPLRADLQLRARALDAVLALPSLVEGWGYVAAEAAACGVPVVAHAASSIPEVVPESAGAVLVPPAGDLAPALAALAAEGPTGRRARGARLREHAERSLGLDRMLTNLENELFRALSLRPPA